MSANPVKEAMGKNKKTAAGKRAKAMSKAAKQNRRMDRKSAFAEAVILCGLDRAQYIADSADAEQRA